MFNIVRSFIHDTKAISLGIKLIIFVLFLRALGWGFADPLFPLYLGQFENKYSVVGSLVSLLQLSSFLMIIPLLRLADHVKESVLIRDGEVIYFFAITCYILAGVFKSIPLLILGLILNGMGQPLIVVGAESYIRKHDKGGHATPFGLYLAVEYFGWILGMVIGAFLIDYYGLNWMFLWIIPSILASFFILPHIRENGLRSFFSGLKKYFHRKEDLVSLMKDVRGMSPKVFFFLLLAFFDGAIRMFSFVFVPLFGLSMNFSLTSISLLMAILYLPFIFSFFFSEIEDRMQRMNVIAMGLFIGALSYVLLFLIVKETWMIALVIMTSFSLAIIRPAYNGAITRLTPRQMMGEVTGFNNLIERLGRILGPILTGFIADVYGLKTTFLAIAILAFSLGVISLLLKGYNALITAET